MAKSQLDTGYFVGPLTVAQLTETSVANDLAWFITRYEEELLKLLLGQPLYDAYLTAMAEITPLPEWVALDSKLYIKTPAKISPAANYVYWFYMRNLATMTTGTGEVLVKGVNSIAVGGAVKAKLAWNDMARKNVELKLWLQNNAETYPLYLEPVLAYSPPEAYQLYKDRKGILRTAIPFF